MAYVDVVDPFLDSGKPGRSADWKQMRDNIRYLKDAADTQALRGLISSQSIADDFMGVIGATGIGSWWTSNTGGGGTATVESQHQLKCASGGGGTWAGVYAPVTGQHISKAEEYVAICEVRVKRPGANADAYFFGWNDASLAGIALINTLTNSVCVSRDAGGNWMARTYNGGATSTVGPFGNAANWERIRLQFTCSATAGSRKVEVYLNDTLQGTMNTDANIPAAVLIPSIGCTNAAAEIRVDYALYTVQARPLAA